MDPGRTLAVAGQAFPPVHEEPAAERAVLLLLATARAAAAAMTEQASVLVAIV